MYSFLNLTKIKFKSKNLFNVSAINAQQNGEFYLLSSAPPAFENEEDVNFIIQQARGYANEIKNGLVITNHFDVLFDLILNHSINNNSTEEEIKKLTQFFYKKVKIGLNKTDRLKIKKIFNYESQNIILFLNESILQK